MNGTSLQRRLNDLVISLQAEGMLDEQFDQLRELQNEENPQFLKNVLELFCQKADEDTGDIADYLTEEPIDFDKVINRAHRIRGSSASIGACRMANVCRELKDYSIGNNKEGCIEAYERVITEYCALHSKLSEILQLLKSIEQSEAS